MKASDVKEGEESGVKEMDSCMVKKLGIGMRSRAGCIDCRVNVDRYSNECISVENIHANDFNYFH
jgi:hypothetical protein